MRWEKLGRIFTASNQYPWMRTHASLPVALPLGGDLYRVYFASRDERNYSHVSYIEIDLRRPHEILTLADQPILAPGGIGTFDEHGVYAASIVPHGDQLWMYYIGWNQGVRAPLFYASIGLAISHDGGRTFAKYSPAPILARSEYDPCLVTSPYVMLDGDHSRMWYVSGFKWDEADGALRSYYHIKYAESRNGIDWERTGTVAIDHEGDERNIARPSVLREYGVYKMWYSYIRGAGYRIGYAESPDGYLWTRKDADAGIAWSVDGWDSQANCYPHVFVHEGRRYMLYNGNGYGRDGFGLAVEAL